MGVARSQGVGVGKNWVLGITVGTNIGAGRVRRCIIVLFCISVLLIKYNLNNISCEHRY